MELNSSSITKPVTKIQLLMLSKPLIFNYISSASIASCNIAGNFFATARALIGYFEVTWHLTMKLFPAKLSEPATSQNHPRMLTDDRRYSEV